MERTFYFRGAPISVINQRMRSCLKACLNNCRSRAHEADFCMEFVTSRGNLGLVTSAPTMDLRATAEDG